MFEQSKLTAAMTARPPRSIDDLNVAEIAYVHPDALIADVDLLLWIKLRADAYKRPPPHWANRYLIVQSVPGGIQVDAPTDFQLKIIPRPTPSEYYAQEQTAYARVQLGKINA